MPILYARMRSLSLCLPFRRVCKHIGELGEVAEEIEIAESTHMAGVISHYAIEHAVAVLEATGMDRHHEHAWPEQGIDPPQAGLRPKLCTTPPHRRRARGIPCHRQSRMQDCRSRRILHNTLGMVLVAFEPDAEGAAGIDGGETLQHCAANHTETNRRRMSRAFALKGVDGQGGDGTGTHGRYPVSINQSEIIASGGVHHQHLAFERRYPEPRMRDTILHPYMPYSSGSRQGIVLMKSSPLGWRGRSLGAARGTILHQKRLAHPIDAPGRTDVERPDIFVCYYFSYISEALNFSAIFDESFREAAVVGAIPYGYAHILAVGREALLAGTVLDENIMVCKQP